MGFGYNLYFTERSKNRVICWNPDQGTTKVVAGDGATGPAEDQRLHDPYGLAVDTSGHVLIADKLRHRVMRLTNRLDVCQTQDRDGHRRDRPDTPAHQKNRIPWCPTGLFVERSGSVLCSFSDDHTIYRLHPDGHMELILGIPPNRPQIVGTCPTFVPQAHIRDAMIWGPTTLVSTDKGVIYFIERGYQTVREYTPGQGLRTLFPPQKYVTFRDRPIAPNAGRLEDFHPTYPSGLALDGAGALYLADATQRTVMRLDVAAGTFTTVAEIPVSAGPRGGPAAITFGPDGTAWMLESRSGSVRAYRAPANGPWQAMPTVLSARGSESLTVNVAGAGLTWSR